MIGRAAVIASSIAIGGGSAAAATLTFNPLNEAIAGNGTAWSSGSYQDANYAYQINSTTRDYIDFRFYEPDLAENEKAPLILFLHGSGGRVNNSQNHLFNGDNLTQLGQSQYFAGGLFQDVQQSFVLAPQIPTRNNNGTLYAPDEPGGTTIPGGSQWASQSSVLTPNTSGSLPHATTWMDLTIGLINAVIADSTLMDRIDTSRIYLVGQSMGGAGAWDLLVRMPNFFEAAVIAAGSGNLDQLSLLAESNTRIWAMDHQSDSFLTGGTGNPANYNANLQLLELIASMSGDDLYLKGMNDDELLALLGQRLVYTEYFGAPPGSFSDVHQWVTSDYFNQAGLAEWLFYIPEPGSLVLLLGGAGLVAGRRRRI